MRIEPDSPIFIDLEASSLGDDSFPIEVAWSMPDGSIENHLIRPRTEWVDWNEYAEREIHHISRAMLTADGKDAVWVAARMNEVLTGRTVYSDAPEFDEQWLLRLFAAAGLEPAFAVGFFDNVLMYAQASDPDGARERIERAQREARERVPHQHRAAWDVEYLLEWWRLARP